MSVPVSLIPEATAYAVFLHPEPQPDLHPRTFTSQLDRHKSPSVQHLQSYDRAMCEATLGTTPSSPSSSSSPFSKSNSKCNSTSTSAAPPPPFHTNPTKPGGVKSKLGLGLGLGKTKPKSGKSGVDSKDGQEAEGHPESKLVSNPPSNSASKSHPTSPGALISQPSQPPKNPISQAYPDDIKKSLTTFEDPLGLGLETLPTTEHADKMAKKGERKIRLGSLLHSGKLVSRTCIRRSGGRISLTDRTFLVVVFDLLLLLPSICCSRSSVLLRIATTRPDPTRQSRTRPVTRDRPTRPGKGDDGAKEG
jgi:hypothetical protein